MPQILVTFLVQTGTFFSRCLWKLNAVHTTIVVSGRCNLNYVTIIVLFESIKLLQVRNVRMLFLGESRSSLVLLQNGKWKCRPLGCIIYTMLRLFPISCNALPNMISLETFWHRWINLLKLWWVWREWVHSVKSSAVYTKFIFMKLMTLVSWNQLQCLFSYLRNFTWMPGLF